jgi:uncharacterized protein
MAKHAGKKWTALSRGYGSIGLLAVLISPRWANADCAAPSPTAQGHLPAWSTYSRQYYEIPMRDGVKLHTLVLTPGDDRHSYPIVLTRSPYRIAEEGTHPTEDYARAGFIFVYQDVRGKGGSEGTFVEMTPMRPTQPAIAVINESTDAYDTVDWLLSHVHRNNGRVGLLGISYAGFYAAAGMIGAHPAVRAVSPQAPQTDWFTGDDVHRNGALVLHTAFKLMYSMAQEDAGKPQTPAALNLGTTNGYKFFLDLGPLPSVDERFFHGEVTMWEELMHHGTLDAYWSARQILPSIRHIAPAVLIVGGWYDPYDLYGTLHLYESVRDKSPQTPLTFVMGPWLHGQWGSECGREMGPGRSSAGYYREHVELPFFIAHLKGGTNPPQPMVYAVDTGTDEWHELHQWPPEKVAPQVFYLGGGGGLLPKLPESDIGGYDEYNSDPEKPVPYTARPGTYLQSDYMLEDQRFLAARPDVLEYTTEELSSDLTVAGEIEPRLYISSSGTDSDFIVKVIDVHPDRDDESCVDCGREELVRGDIMRAKFRDSLSSPRPLVPGAKTLIQFKMLDIFHTFKIGHRIKVQIQSSWFPLIDRNPQSFLDIYNARATDFRKETERVYRSPDAASSLIFPIWTR